MGQYLSTEEPVTTEVKPTDPIEKSKNTQPVPSRESEGYKYLSKKLNEIRKSMALEEGFILIDREEQQV